MVCPAKAWYKHHVSLSPLDRIKHPAEAPPALCQEKWERMERRVASMILQSVPSQVRDELVASRRLSTFGVLTYLLVTYSPGGVSEKQNLLRNPGGIQNVLDGPIALRRWLRWRTRTKEIGAIAPDTALQFKGLLKMTKRTLESHRELQFKVSLVRSGLQVDTTPSEVNVEQFAYHLLAEFEQLALTEKRSGTPSDPQKPKPQEAEKPKVAKLKKLEEETKSPTRRMDFREEKPKCKFYLSEQGCRRGKACNWSHDQKDERRRCWNCGSPEHMAPACTRPKERGDASPTKPKIQKVEGQDSSSTSSKVKEDKEST